MGDGETSRVPPPAGWYPDPQSGAQRWWDGTSWGAFAAPPPRSTGDNSAALAVLSHLAIFLAPIILPLILYLTVGTTDPRVRQQAREALNFQLTFLIVWLSGFFLVFGWMAVNMTRGFGSSFGPGGDPFVGIGPGFGAFAVVPLLFALYLGAMLISVVAAVQAGRGEAWRYPVSIRLVGRAEARNER